jgi:adenylate cyclase
MSGHRRRAVTLYRPVVGRSKRLISYRLSLAFVIPVLVVVTGALVAAVSYTTTRSSIRELAASLFAQIADQTAEQARSHVREAAPAVDMLARMMASPGDSDETARRMLLVLHANPGFSWASFSSADGAFTGAQRLPDGTLLINRSTIANGVTTMTEQTVAADGTWQPRRHLDNTGYDPRTRPFYTRAVAAKGRVWTEPYVFFDQGIPGITCAAPVYGEAGALLGVVTVDFDLEALSAYVAQLHASEHARVFVYTEAGVVLAHPSAKIVATTGHGADGALVTKADIDDAAARAYFNAGSAAFSVDGERYFAATRAFEPDVGLHWRVGAIAPESDFMGSLERITRDALIVSIVVVLLAVAFALTFAQRIARPLVYLAREMDNVGQFHLDGAEPPPSRYREIDLMNGALSRMRESLASFAVYVPRDLVRAVLASGHRAELGGKTKPMSVLFSDLAGFTSLSETMTPAALVELLAKYFDAMSTVLEAHDGTIDKFIGDAIMAFWNAPGDDAEHAVHACTAALAFQRRLDEMKRADPSLGSLSARIGIATGDVVVGNIGSHDRMNYTVMGDTVNLASRLEGLGKAYGTKILVSEACHRAAGERIVMRAIDVVAVKGKTQGVRVYEPLAAAADADDRLRTIAALSEQALGAYLARRFDEAGTLYAKLAELAPNDHAAPALRTRCDALHANPPADDWSGVHVMHEK